MEIQTGLLPHMVTQRGRNGRSDARVTGRTTAAGTVQAQITRARRPIKGFQWTAVGRASRGTFTARITGLPAGGPYRVDLRIVTGRPSRVLDAVTVADVLVGDLWIAAGQSNMQGFGMGPPLPAKPDVRAFHMDDRWAPARDPIHETDIAIDPVHNVGRRATRHAYNSQQLGPAIAFAREMRRSTGVPQGILACAHGGTKMLQWDPALRDQAGASLYGATYRRFIKNGGRVAGLLWYQGESDALPDFAPLYLDRMKALIAAFRKDCGDPRLPIVMAQLGRFAGKVASPASWNQVQEAQRQLGHQVKRLAVTPAVDLTLSDAVHLSGPAVHTLGQRMAQAMASLLKLPRSGKLPIALRSASPLPDLVSRRLAIRVEFDNVEGTLRAGHRPKGFALIDPAGNNIAVDTLLDGHAAIIRTVLGGAGEMLANMRLHYGYGNDPPCNVFDSAGRPLPVFGPLQLIQPVALTPFVRRFRFAAVPGEHDDLRRLKHPHSLDALGLTERHFPTDFCDVHQDPALNNPCVCYFACRLHCPQPMRLSLLAGYDAPVKVWIDGKPAGADPNGTNPALPDLLSIPFAARAGSHEILVALSWNAGRAWGIYLRLARRDVDPRLLRQAPGSVMLPTTEA